MTRVFECHYRRIRRKRPKTFSSRRLPLKKKKKKKKKIRPKLHYNTKLTLVCFFTSSQSYGASSALLATFDNVAIAPTTHSSATEKLIVHEKRSAKKKFKFHLKFDVDIDSTVINEQM
jgi:hypothetical protein